MLLPRTPVIDWLKGLAWPLRYSAYVAGALLAFVAAAGVGATAALVFDRQPEPHPERAASVHAGRTSPEGTTFEGTAAETTDASKRAEAGGESQAVSFVHRATDANSRGDYTYISDPSIDADPDAIVLVTPASPASGGAMDDVYPHNIGVWYESGAEEWAIFDQDRAAVPAGAAFEVRVPRASDAFVHSAAPANTVGDTTYLDDPRINGEPGALVSVTQNWNPGGGRGVYNDHPVGVLYDKGADEWAIYNKDGAPMPEGAAFNVTFSGGGGPGR